MPGASIITAVLSAIRAWGFWPVLAECGGKALRWLLSDLWRVAAIACLIGWGVQTIRMDGLILRPLGITLINHPGWRPRALAAEANVDRLIAASKQAAAQAEANRIATEAASAAHARKADHEPPPAIAAQRTAADRYADDHRLFIPPLCGATGPATTPAPADPAPDRDRSSADAVVIPRAHFDQLRDNTLRLERIRLWGEGEVEAGRAAKVEEEK